MVATANGHIEIVKMLLEHHDINITIRNNNFGPDGDVRSQYVFLRVQMFTNLLAVDNFLSAFPTKCGWYGPECIYSRSDK